MEDIKIENLTFKYPGKAALALKNINLTIKRGEFLLVCGKSGCGKSTLLRSLKPSLAPYGERSGKIYFGEKESGELTSFEAAEKIGFVLQEPGAQIVCDKVWHEMAFGLENLGYPPNEIRARVAETASYFGLSDIFYKDVSALSGGQMQLLTLASVVALMPSVIILDEPLSLLSPTSAQEFLEILRKINRELGITVIISEHRQSEVFPIADRVAFMECGEIAALDTPQNIGRILWEKKNDMFFALPTQMQVFYSVKSNVPCPLTIRDGRAWLSKREIKSLPKSAAKTDDAERKKKKTALRAKNVWFRYEKSGADILKGFSIDVKEGEFYAIVGANGAGKTTAAKVLCGLLLPYRGKTFEEKGKKAVLLPQNPKDLFSRNTLYDEFWDVLEDSSESGEKKDKIIKEAAEFCGLYEYLSSHPYDLSGGEMQRAALLMVLLKKPDIILMDEPTKGIDAYFKVRLAKIIEKLCARGVSIIAVSHDIEFCAKYAARCGMFFDGKIVSEAPPKEFFAGNSFYTTAARRMSRGIIDGAVSEEDIIDAIGGKVPKLSNSDFRGGSSIFGDDDFRGADFKDTDFNNTDFRNTAHYNGKNGKRNKGTKDKPKGENKNKEKNKNGQRSKLKKSDIIIGTLLAVLFAAVQIFLCGKFEGAKEWAFEAMAIMLAAFSVMKFLPKKQTDKTKFEKMKHEKGAPLPFRTVFAAAVAVILVPLTVFIGMYCMGDRKYYFISLLIILEIMIPFAIVFEGRHNFGKRKNSRHRQISRNKDTSVSKEDSKSWDFSRYQTARGREMVIISVLCAIAVASRAAFMPLPQFKPIVAVCIISGIAMGAESGFLVGAVSGFVSNFFFSQGPWTPWQMFALGIIGFLSGILYRTGIIKISRTKLCIYGFLATFVLYGVIMNTATLLMSGAVPSIKLIAAYCLTGLPFDSIHAVSTAFFLYVAAEPMFEKLFRVKIKYGI